MSQAAVSHTETTTAAEAEPTVLHVLAREARHRRVTVLYGNVADRFEPARLEPARFDPAPLGGHAARGASNTPATAGALLETDLASAAAQSLMGHGFAHALLLDPLGRVRFLSPADGAWFGARWQSGAEPTPEAAPRPGVAYDLEAPAPESGPEPGTARGAPAPERLDPVELFEGLAARPIRFRGLVVVLDWAHLQVGDPARLAPEDRAWALALGRCAQAGPPPHLRPETLALPHVVLVARTLGQVPPLLYQAEARVRLVAVPLPGHRERLRFWTEHRDALRCAAVRPAPGDFRPAGTLLALTLADLTDGLTRVDLQQMISLSHGTPEPLAPDRLLNLYRFGDERSPWEELPRAKVAEVEARLAARVVGQPEAIAHVGNLVRRAWLGLSGLQHSARATTPKGKLFFAGPTGVGKTELAKALAAFLFGDERACLRFDMSEYNHEHSDQRLVGAPPGYVGFEEGGQLTNAVRARPFSVLLFDEVEKAHPRILDKFLQILEDGRLTDGRGETTWFGETVIIFTSNLGAAGLPPGCDAEARRSHFTQAVERHFVETLGRPELLNRLGDNIVPFAPVTDRAARLGLLRRKLQPIVQHFELRYGVTLEVPDAVLAWLALRARDEHGGRGLLNAVERDLVDVLARHVFDHQQQMQRGRVLSVQLGDDAQGEACLVAAIGAAR